ncbi:GSCFA domain-containing protein [Winogradskyella ursingii]|uniref:GSCFA domain-containing protein n=1 Tax=Winogradskyella ursingii TaxID=2686079 RepID=UPI0015CC6578|nr:GSCFA domain-containing protein [Winogradskyella ursingii]
MKLQTNIPFNKQQHNQIDYGSKTILLGSCFTENIGEKFEYYKFQSLVNPFGILFHPLAIENLVTKAINRKYYSENDLIFHNEQWLCLDAHSKLNSTTKDELLQQVNHQIDEAHQFLNSASHIIITLGTSWVYREISSDKIVANCHKLPQKRFLKELLSVDEISESLQSVISLVRDTNPKVNFIFTVSPVRHLKDGFVENMQSKSHLVAAIQQVIEPRKQLYYFPSYEIMMDELRDYRFYNQDMIHPNQVAINYIWDKFKHVWCSEDTLNILTEVETIQKGLGHKPFNFNSESHQKFLLDLKSKIDSLRSRHPNINFS